MHPIVRNTVGDLVTQSPLLRSALSTHLSIHLESINKTEQKRSSSMFVCFIHKQVPLELGIRLSCVVSRNLLSSDLRVCTLVSSRRCAVDRLSEIEADLRISDRADETPSATVAVAEKEASVSRCRVTRRTHASLENGAEIQQAFVPFDPDRESPVYRTTYLCTQTAESRANLLLEKETRSRTERPTGRPTDCLPD